MVAAPEIEVEKNSSKLNLEAENQPTKESTDAVSQKNSALNKEEEGKVQKSEGVSGKSPKSAETEQENENENASWEDVEEEDIEPPPIKFKKHVPIGMAII